MSNPVFACPSTPRLSDVCRHLRPGQVRAVDPHRQARVGDLVVVTPLPGAPGLSFRQINGRVASAYPGDPVLAVAARYHNPLGASCEPPDAGDVAQWVSPSGIVGRACDIGGRDGVCTDVRLLGVAVDAAGRPVGLSDLVAPQTEALRPALSLAVISAARGARASQVAEALVLGLSQTGQIVGAAKPFGLVDARGRWRLLDHGAALALDPVDSGLLDVTTLAGDALLGLLQRQQSLITSAGGQASVVRLGGGLASTAMARLLGQSQTPRQFDGVVIAAADALSAVEAVARIESQGLRVLAVSGALARSPLASREAEAALDVPILSAEALAQASTLQRLISQALRPFQNAATALPLAA